jgi:hypothetical protein
MIRKKTKSITELPEYQEILRAYRIAYFMWTNHPRGTKARTKYWNEYVAQREKLLALIENYRQVGINIEDSL